MLNDFYALIHNFSPHDGIFNLFSEWGEMQFLVLFFHLKLLAFLFELQLLGVHGHVFLGLHVGRYYL